jgi:DUF4097 and DUF4098 domain-containing protein YvlB
LFSNNTFAGDKVNQSLTVSPEGTLFINISRGLVKIKGWDKNEVSIQGELDDSAKALIFKSKGDDTLIKAESKGEKQWGDSSVVKIFMPFQTKLYFKGVNTTFILSSLKGGVKGKTISGDLVAEKLSNEIALSSMGGHIKVINSIGKAKLETVGGDISISGSYSEALIRTMTGNVNLDINSSDKIEAKTVSGDLFAKGDVKTDAVIKLSSVSGNIIYQASEGLDAECSLSSQFGGEITNKLTEDAVKDSSMNGKNLSFISGDGSGSIILHTISGNVTINKGLKP